MSAPHSSAFPAPPRRSRDLALVAIFVGIVAALGLVPAIYPFGLPVPITAQTLGVMLAGAVLGARRGGLALLVFILLVAAGLPLLAGGRGGIGVFATPTVGFLLGFPVAAFAGGWLTQRAGAPYRVPFGVAANVAGGILLLYALGIPGLALVGGLPLTVAATASLVYLPGDLVKAVLAALVAAGVHRAYPGLLPARSRRDREASAV